MKILALDLGATTGWAYVNGDDFEVGSFTEKTGYVAWGRHVKELIDVWKPDIVVCSQTHAFGGNFGSTRQMFMRYGVVCYIAEGLGYPVVEFPDNQARKLLFGTIKRDPKKKVKQVAHEKLAAYMEGTELMTEDEKDALVLGLGWQKFNQE